jgi:hypothetical protein
MVRCNVHAEFQLLFFTTAPPVYQSNNMGDLKPMRGKRLDFRPIKSPENMSAGPVFATGSVIPEGGIYRVIHARHRLPHEVTLVKGQQFPRCSKCKSEVVFELVHPAPSIEADHSFRIVLYELPVLEDDAPAIAV